MTYLIPLILFLSILNGIILQKLWKSRYDLDKLIENEFVFKVPSAYKWLAYVLMLVGFLTILIGLHKFGFETNSLIIILSIALFTFLIGAFTLLYQKNHRVTITGEHVIIFGPFNRKVSVSWLEIKSIRLNPVINMYVLKYDRDTIRFNQHLIGLSVLFAFAREKGIKTLPNKV